MDPRVSLSKALYFPERSRANPLTLQGYAEKTRSCHSRQKPTQVTYR